MKPIKQTVTAFLLGLFAMTSISLAANETEKQLVVVQVDKSDNQDAKVEVKVDGSAESFNLPEMEVGDSKTIITESGKSVTLNKTEGGITMDIDGKSVPLPLFSGNLGARIHRSMPLHHMTSDQITISGVELDDSQKQIIRDAFLTAGITDKKVLFATQKFMVLSSEHDFESDGNTQVMQWHSKDGGEVEIEVMADQLHVDESGQKHVIKIQKKHD